MGVESPITRDHRLYRGTDRKLVFTVYATMPSQASAGVILDITGKEASWVLVTAKSADPATLTKTSPSAGVAILGTFNADPAINTQRVEVTIAAADTAALTPGRYWYDLWCDTSGEKDVWAEGPLDLLEPGRKTS
jgi:hypothetical protein